LFTHAGRKQPLFITLTLKPSARELGDQVAYLKSCFSRLRLTQEWKQRCTFGMAVVEVTRGAKGNHWHAHLHVVVWAAYYNNVLLSQQWKRITCGSFITDVQRCRDTGKLREYVAGYVCKPPAEACYHSRELAAEWYRALRRAHWVIRFGPRGKTPKAESSPKVNDWQTVCRLAELLPWLEGANVKDAVAAFQQHTHHTQYEELIDHVIDTT
jgi:hypothetical protein